MGRLLQNRLVPDPSMTDAEFLHQKNRERERAQTVGVKPNLDVGKVWAQENAMSRMGALCYIRPPKRQPHHEMAAELFKSLYEARYGAGNPAMDTSRIIVDSSPVAHDSGMAGKLDRTWKLQQAKEGLTSAAFDRLVAVLVLEVPAGEGVHWRNRSAMVDLILTDLDTLCGIWELRSKAA